MKNAMKKLLSLTLALIMVVGVFPMAAFAAENDEVDAAALTDWLDDERVQNWLDRYPDYKDELCDAIRDRVFANATEIYQFILTWIQNHQNQSQNPPVTPPPADDPADDPEDEPEETTYTITLVIYEEKDNTRKEWATKEVTLSKNSTNVRELIAKSGYGEYESATAKINGWTVGNADFVVENGAQVDLYIVPESKGTPDKDEKPGNKPENNKPTKPEDTKPENTKPGKGEKVTLRVFHNDGTGNYTDISCRTTDGLLDVINSSKELRNLSRKGYELIGWAFEANNDTEKEWIAAQHTVADDDDLRVYADWKETIPGNNRPDDNDDYHNVYVDLNYDNKMGETVKRVIDGAKMSRVLKYVEEPTRRGYSFAGWYWDAKCKDDVDGDEKVTEDCTIYAKWTRRNSDKEVLLKIYLNENTKAAAKVVDMDAYDNDGKITLTEVEKVVRKYYEEKYRDDDMDIDGLFTAKTWNNGRYSMKNAKKAIEVNEHDDTVIYVMVRDAQKISSGTADTSNPKTGDNIMMVVSVMIMSGAALAYVFSKKRAAR